MQRLELCLCTRTGPPLAWALDLQLNLLIRGLARRTRAIRCSWKWVSVPATCLMTVCEIGLCVMHYSVMCSFVVLTSLAFHELDVCMTQSIYSSAMFIYLLLPMRNSAIDCFCMQDGVALEGLEQKSKAFRILLREAIYVTSGISTKVLEFPWMTRMSTTEETKATTLLHGWKQERKVASLSVHTQLRKRNEVTFFSLACQLYIVGLNKEPTM